MEHLRSLKITVEIDTNKGTYTEIFTLEEDETVEELLQQVEDWIEVNLP